MDIDTSIPSEVKGYHITYWHDYRFELVGVTYLVKTIQEALEEYNKDPKTPSTERIKYVLAVDDIEIKKYKDVPSNT